MRNLAPISLRRSDDDDRCRLADGVARDPFHRMLTGKLVRGGLRRRNGHPANYKFKPNLMAHAGIRLYVGNGRCVGSGATAIRPNPTNRIGSSAPSWLKRVAGLEWMCDGSLVLDSHPDPIADAFSEPLKTGILIVRGVWDGKAWERTSFKRTAHGACLLRWDGTRGVPDTFFEELPCSVDSFWLRFGGLVCIVGSSPGRS